MKIIIAGGGEVGLHLAELLSFENQDITLIDTEKRSLQIADNQLDIKTIRGDSTSISVLKEAEVSKADLVIAVTSSQATNITISVIAKQLGCKRSIARISNTEFIYNKKDIKFDELGIDELISPDQLAALEIEQLVSESAFNNVHKFGHSHLSLAGVSLPKNSPFAGKTIVEISKHFSEIDSLPIAIQRKGSLKTIIPRGGTTFEEEDQIYFITCQEGVKQLHNLVGKKPEKLKKIMILGGSIIGVKTAKILSQKGFEVKLFEINKDKAYELADELHNVLIINGDGRNGSLLEEENISATDVFISVTSDSETNLMACMMAKKKNVKKTIALTQNTDYHQFMQHLGIDNLLNKKILAANSIFRHISLAKIENITSLIGTDAEILEIIVQNQSAAVGKKIKDLDFPKTAIIGGVIRGEESFLPLGDFEILANDHIIVCSLFESIKKIEKIFV